MKQANGETVVARGTDAFICTKRLIRRVALISYKCLNNGCCSPFSLPGSLDYFIMHVLLPFLQLQPVLLQPTAAPVLFPRSNPWGVFHMVDMKKKFD